MYCIYDENIECSNCDACLVNDDLTEEDLELIRDLNSI